MKLPLTAPVLPWKPHFSCIQIMASKNMHFFPVFVKNWKILTRAIRARPESLFRGRRGEDVRGREDFYTPLQTLRLTIFLFVFSTFWAPLSYKGLEGLKYAFSFFGILPQ